MSDSNARDPFKLFNSWFETARENNVKTPDAMSLATIDAKTGHPRVRTVLYKGLNRNRLWFVTSYLSPKSRDLEAHPHAALCFFWEQEPWRQVRVEGKVEKLTPEESAAYFATRPRESQLGAWASEQSSIIPDREYLDALYSKYDRRFSGQEVPCPETWGGWALTPTRFEFWEARTGRMHDRFQLVYHHGSWHFDRLAP